jgi:photosystem II stability/assembly factor-like uncharacterized protein
MMNIHLARVRLLTTLAVMLLAALACSLPGTFTPTPPGPATNTPAPPTDTPVPGPVTATPTSGGSVISAPELTRIDMLDTNNGWALADHYVLRSADGGATWNDVTPAGITDVGYSADGFFMDAGNAWVLIGTPADPHSGTLYHTTDGGANWSSAAVPFASANLQFLDSSNGFALAALGAGAGSEAVAVYQTADGGATWTQNYINDPTVPGAGDSLPLGGQKAGMTFVDTQHGWVSGAEPIDDFVYFYVTQDGGHSWAQQNVVLPPLGPGLQIGAQQPLFFGTQIGVLPTIVLNGSQTLFMFFKTQDGGTTWMPTSTLIGSGRYMVLSANDAWVWTGSGLSVTHDGMITWTSLTPNVDLANSLSQLDFVDTLTGWALANASGSHNALYKTTDGGTTWTAIIP